MKKLIIILMMALLSVFVQGGLIANFTFDGGDSEGFTKWDANTCTATFINDDFRCAVGSCNSWCEYYVPIDFPTNKDISITYNTMLDGSIGRYGSIGIVNESSHLNGGVSDIRSFGRQNNLQGTDSINLYELGGLVDTCPYSFSASDGVWYLMEEIYSATTGNISVYIDGAYVCEMNRATNIEDTDDYFLLMAYADAPGYQSRYDNVTISWDNPIITLESDLVNNTINYNDENITITYWGDFEDTTDYIYNCDLYVDGQLNQTDTEIDLTQNQTFFVEWGNAEKDFTFEISCIEGIVDDVQYNWTFTGGSNESWYKWDTDGSDADFSNNDYRTDTTSPAVWGYDAGLPTTLIVEAVLEADDNNLGGGRPANIFIFNKSSGTSPHTDARHYLNFNMQSDQIGFYEYPNSLYKTCAYDFNKLVLLPNIAKYDIDWIITDKYSEVYVDDVFVCSALSNYSFNADDDIIAFYSHTNSVAGQGFRTFWDDILLLWEDVVLEDTTGEYVYSVDTIDPRITLDMVNGTIYTKVLNPVITINSTYYDPNLFAYNRTVYNSTGFVIYNEFAQNFNETNTTTIINQTILDADVLDVDQYFAKHQLWDSHTNNKVKELQWYFQDNNLIADGEIIFEGDLKELDAQDNPATYFYLSPDETKYKLKVTWNEDSLTHVLNLTASGNLVFLPGSSFPGHFVYMPTSRWIDFFGDNINSIDVEEVLPNKYQITIYHDTSTDEIEFESLGSLNTRIKETTFEILACPESWQPAYTSCTIGDNQTLYYIDANACGTYDNLPGDNGTISSCNYCTLAYHFEDSSSCIDYNLITVPLYDNFEICCNVTGIDADCDLPSNFSSDRSCTGIHSASEITGAVIDFGVEGILVLITLITIIVGVVLLAWGIRTLKRK